VFVRDMQDGGASDAFRFSNLTLIAPQTSVPHTSHLTPHTSLLTASHLTPHTSHLTPYNSEQVLHRPTDDLIAVDGISIRRFVCVSA